MKRGITAVILNWKRTANVTQIVSNWQASGLISEAIVWNNNPETSFSHDWAKVVNAQSDLGLYTRFAAACLGQHECVLIQDDDVDIPKTSLCLLQDAWLKDMEILHGVFGRTPKPDGSYARVVYDDAEVPIVLTRALMVHRRFTAAFFSVASEFHDIQRDSCPAGNGEDIILSYVAMAYSGRQNRIHRCPVVELPAPHAIHRRDRRAHVAHRSRLLQACEAWLRRRDTGIELTITRQGRIN